MFTILSITSLEQGNLYPGRKTSRTSYQSDIDAAIARRAAAQDLVERPHFAGTWIATLA